MLYLDKQEYLGFIKLQADRKLGRSYAGKLAFVEGLFHLGYLSKQNYENYVKKYSQGLNDVLKKPLTREEMERQAKIQGIEKILTEAYRIWNTLKPSAQQYHLKTAQQHQELPIAQLIIKEKGVINE